MEILNKIFYLKSWFTEQYKILFNSLYVFGDVECNYVVIVYFFVFFIFVFNCLTINRFNEIFILLFY